MAADGPGTRPLERTALRLPKYVAAELRAYMKCGLFSEGFSRAHCDACGRDLLVAFSCKVRTVCPSCTGRRMANSAAAMRHLG
ncbi:MAG: transposase zinc-binding domain-containing protein [Polyangiaceae bacterium]